MKIVSLLGSCGNWKNDEFCGKMNAFLRCFQTFTKFTRNKGGRGEYSISFRNKRQIKIVFLPKNRSAFLVSGIYGVSVMLVATRNVGFCFSSRSDFYQTIIL